MKSQIIKIETVSNKYKVSYDTGSTKYYSIENPPKTVKTYLAKQETVQTESKKEENTETEENTGKQEIIAQEQSRKEEKTMNTMNTRTYAEMKKDTRLAITQMTQAIRAIASVPMWYIYHGIKATIAIIEVIFLIWYATSDWIDNTTSKVVYKVVKIYKVLYGGWLMAWDIVFKGYEIIAKYYKFITNWFNKAWMFREELVKEGVRI